jgi:hypothetical protein
MVLLHTTLKDAVESCLVSLVNADMGRRIERFDLCIWRRVAATPILQYRVDLWRMLCSQYTEVETVSQPEPTIVAIKHTIATGSSGSLFSSKTETKSSRHWLPNESSPSKNDNRMVSMVASSQNGWSPRTLPCVVVENQRNEERDVKILNGPWRRLEKYTCDS